MSSSDSSLDRRKFLRGALPVALGVDLAAGPPAAALPAQGRNSSPPMNGSSSARRSIG
jgi:hypothetical protein